MSYYNTQKKTMKPDSTKIAERKAEITSNMEDYLKAIHELSEEQNKEEIRIKDIGDRLGVTRPSVVGMIKHLEEHELVSNRHYGGVELTGIGRKVAEEMADRHGVIRRFLEQVLGLDAEIAEEDACKMEHALSPETIDRFVALEEFRREVAEKEAEKEEVSFRRYLRERRMKSPPGRAKEDNEETGKARP